MTPEYKQGIIELTKQNPDLAIACARLAKGIPLTDQDIQELAEGRKIHPDTTKQEWHNLGRAILQLISEREVTLPIGNTDSNT